jgi:hypothetical protein
MKKPMLYLNLLILSIFVTPLRADDTVKLLLIRSVTANTQCDVKFVPGKIYGVPSNMNLPSISTSIGLEFISNTEELPFNMNISNISSISTNIYEAKIREDESKAWMKDNIHRSWRLELQGTGHRTNIQFHYGKDHKWSAGCIILVNDGSKPLMCAASGTENSPELAVKALRDYVLKNSFNSETKIKIKIIDQY